jgi:hypothetical protein
MTGNHSGVPKAAAIHWRLLHFRRQPEIRCPAKMSSNRFQDMDGVDKVLGECVRAGKWTEKKAAEWWKTIKTKESEE